MGKINLIANPGTAPNYCSIEYNIWYLPHETFDEIETRSRRSSNHDLPDRSVVARTPTSLLMEDAQCLLSTG